MAKKITVRDIFGFETKELKDLSVALNGVIVQASHLKTLGIKIKGKSNEELMVLIKENE